MRCRPPLPSSFSLSMYDNDYARRYAAKFGGSYPAQSAIERSLPLLLQEMDEADIAYGVYQVSNADCSSVNQEAYQLWQEHGERFRIFGTAHIHDRELTLSELDRYIINGPFSGLNIDAGSPQLGDRSVYIDDEMLFDFYEICQEHDLPVTFAFGGYAYPDPSAYLPVRIENVAKTFPHLRLGFCHGGWPYFAQISAVCLQYPSVYIIPDGYLMGLPASHDFVLAANYLLPDQIMFGTSYPFHDQKHVAEYYLNAGFSAEALPKVMHDNAARFLSRA